MRNRLLFLLVPLITLFVVGCNFEGRPRLEWIYPADAATTQPTTKPAPFPTADVVKDAGGIAVAVAAHDPVSVATSTAALAGLLWGWFKSRKVKQMADTIAAITDPSRDRRGSRDPTGAPA